MDESRHGQPDLAARLQWARKNMPLTEQEIRRLPALKGMRADTTVDLYLGNLG